MHSAIKPKAVRPVTAAGALTAPTTSCAALRPTTCKPSGPGWRMPDAAVAPGRSIARRLDGPSPLTHHPPPTTHHPPRPMQRRTLMSLLPATLAAALALLARTADAQPGRTIRLVVP